MTASDALEFACQCGGVTGWIEHATPKDGDYVVCHCHDCQDLTRYLGQADAILDEFGGSHLYQSRCARVKIETGTGQLRSLHLTDAKTLRWYTACCLTPLFNSYTNGRLPYVTTQLAACDKGKACQLLGEPLGHLFTKDSPADASHLPQLSFAKLMRRFFVRMLKDLLGRQRRESPLFDNETLEPISSPRRLTETERMKLVELRP